MDIQPSSTSKSKPGAARPIAERKASPQSSKVRNSSSSQPVSIPIKQERKEGAVVRGQILDHRYNEITIQLEPGRQLINARLSGDVPLAIGQDAQFLIVEDDSEHLVLKYIPENASPSEGTIQKALTASGLPANDLNRSIVEELLRHTMPVDKQTLQAFSRWSLINRDASPLTLVLMYKNNIPMTPANINQFEAYQNGSSRLLNDIHRITAGITELLTPETPGGNPEATLPNEEVPPSALATKPLIGSAAIIQEVNGEAIPQALQLNNRLLDLLLGKDGLPFDASVHGKINSLLTQLQQGAISSGDSQNSISSLLTQKERASLAEMLRRDSTLYQLADPVQEGSLSTKDLFSAIRLRLPVMERAEAERLLASVEYHTLLEKSFHDKWTITPEKLSKKQALVELYEDLRKDMEQLSAFAKLEIPAKEASRLQEPLHKLQENLRFMQALNERYAFLQLPVQLKNQDVHTELYVFTRKKALQDKEELSVLLHLDMSRLGAINIHIRMKHNHVRARFSTEKQETQQLLSEYMPSLSETLMKKGYQLHSEVNQGYEKINFSKDFIEEPTAEQETRRYTFDIRT